MKRILGTAAAILIAGAAFAQTATTTTTTVITPAQQTAVKSYLEKQKPKVVTAPAGFTVTTGAVLPEAIEVQSFPADVGVTGHRYAVIGGRTVLVGSDRKIVHIID
jgi:Protein of unknown function (DUF1236)